VVAAFQAACTTGDVAALAQLLDDHVVLRTDGGGVAPAARRPVQGRDRVVRTVVAGLAALPAHTFERRMVNGGPGLVMRSQAGCGVVSLVVADGRVTEVDIVLNPQKLAGL
jgi:RNA polymerase sigma-70 factor (ECF subfamily)